MKITRKFRRKTRKSRRKYKKRGGSTFSKYLFGKKNKVNTYANNHLEEETRLRTKPFLVHLNTDRNVIII